MTNDDILNTLMEADSIESSDNAMAVEKELPNWDKSVSEFPWQEVYKYIKLDRWKPNDFTFRREKIIKDVLPIQIYPVYLDMKKFMSSGNNSLTNFEITYAKFKGLRHDTYEEQAFVYYMICLEKYCNFKLKEDN